MIAQVCGVSKSIIMGKGVQKGASIEQESSGRHFFKSVWYPVEYQYENFGIPVYRAKSAIESVVGFNGAS